MRETRPVMVVALLSLSHSLCPDAPTTSQPASQGAPPRATLLLLPYVCVFRLLLVQCMLPYFSCSQEFQDGIVNGAQWYPVYGESSSYDGEGFDILGELSFLCSFGGGVRTHALTLSINKLTSLYCTCCSNQLMCNAGGMQDWTYLAAGCMDITLELSDDKWRPVGDLGVLWEENKDALLALPIAAVLGGRWFDGLGGGGLALVVKPVVSLT